MSHRLIVLAREAGFRGLFAGLGPRMIMTAGLVSSQFLMYGSIKHGKPQYHHLISVDRINHSFVFPAIGAPPGLEIHKE